jgi:hypothetical protein
MGSIPVLDDGLVELVRTTTSPLPCQREPHLTGHQGRMGNRSPRRATRIHQLPPRISENPIPRRNLPRRRLVCLGPHHNRHALHPDSQYLEPETPAVLLPLRHCNLLHPIPVPLDLVPDQSRHDARHALQLRIQRLLPLSIRTSTWTRRNRRVTRTAGPLASRSEHGFSTATMQALI